MRNLPTIIKREYLSRVRRKSFLLMTILTPLLIVVAALIPSFLIDEPLGEKESVLLFGDKNGFYTEALQRNSDFVFVEATDEFLEESDPSESFSAMLYLPEALEETPNLVFVVSNYELSSRLTNHLNSRLSEAASLAKMQKSDPKLAERWAGSQVEVHCQSMKNVQSEMGNDETASLISIAISFLLYLFIFSYGSQVMRSVTEEKSNKIMEIMFLSTRPSLFISGKIIGIALVGLTQFALWGLAGLALYLCLSDNVQAIDTLQHLALPEAIDSATLALLFIVFFLGGYFLYASLFASIGALSDPSTDTQQFFLPVTIPIIFSIYAGIYTACHPESALALWCSYIPFTSPIVMLARVCHGVAALEIGGSLLLLASTDILLFFLSGKVYQSAILFHGKRVTYKDLWRFCKG